MTLNYLCAHDISDEDCYKCSIHGIRLRCPNNCKDFSDVRGDMNADVLYERSKIMKHFGLKDRYPWEEPGDIDPVTFDEERGFG